MDTSGHNISRKLITKLRSGAHVNTDRISTLELYWVISFNVQTPISNTITLAVKSNILAHLYKN